MASLKTKSNAINTLVYLPVKDVFSLLHYASVVSVSDLEVNTVCSFDSVIVERKFSGRTNRFSMGP